MEETSDGWTLVVDISCDSAGPLNQNVHPDKVINPHQWFAREKEESKPGLEAFSFSGNETNNLAEKKKILAFKF